MEAVYRRRITFAPIRHWGGPAGRVPEPVPWLVSLVYNRGTSMCGADDSREMRDMRDAVAAGRFEDIPASAPIDATPLARGEWLAGRTRT